MSEELEITTRTRSRRVDTNGLAPEGLPELCLQYAHDHQVDGAEEFMDFLLSHLASGARLKDGETLSFGSWLTRAVLDDPVEGYLNIWEYDEPNDQYCPVLNVCLDLWTSQRSLCKEMDSDFCPPRPLQLVAIGRVPDNADHSNVTATRFPTEESDSSSGWYISFGEIPDDADWRDIHLVHVASIDDSLLHYLALEPGFCLDREDGFTSVSYDSDVLKE